MGQVHMGWGEGLEQMLMGWARHQGGPGPCPCPSPLVLTPLSHSPSWPGSATPEAPQVPCGGTKPPEGAAGARGSWAAPHSLRGVWEGLQPELRPGTAPHHPHRGATIHLQCLQEGLQPEFQPGHTPVHPHQGEALRMPELREALSGELGAGAAPVDAHRGAAVQMWGMWEELQHQLQPAATPNPGARAAPSLPRVWGHFLEPWPAPEAPQGERGVRGKQGGHGDRDTWKGIRTAGWGWDTWMGIGTP